MRKAGAVIDDVTTADPTTPTAEGRVPFDDEFTVLLFEFKVQIAQYLARLKHTDMRTLADLIAFNLAHCDEEMRYFGQEVFELAEATSGDLTDPEYLAAWRTNRTFGRTVIDSLLAQGYQAVITPSFSFGTSNPAIAGYPSISVPVGFSATGQPVGIWLAAGFLHEPTLLGLAYATEQLLHGRTPPELKGTAPVYPDAGICAAPAPLLRRPQRANYSRHSGPPAATRGATCRSSPQARGRLRGGRCRRAAHRSAARFNSSGRCDHMKRKFLILTIGAMLALPGVAVGFGPSGKSPRGCGVREEHRQADCQGRQRARRPESGRSRTD